MSKPLVSVIMPTYNCEAFIGDAIQSVLCQTVQDWEIVIVDDCSTDHTQQIVTPYLGKNPNICYYRLNKNCGAAIARTEAIRCSQGKYAAFLDSDDLWVPTKLEKQIGFMETTGVPFSCTAYEWIDEQGRDLQTVLTPPEQTDYRKMVWLSNPIGNLTVMYDQEQLGKYEVPKLMRCEDTALWLKILKNTPCCVGMPDVLAKYRIRAHSASRNKLCVSKNVWKLHREIEQKGFLYSCYAWSRWAFVKGTGIGLNRRHGSTK